MSDPNSNVRRRLRLRGGHVPEKDKTAETEKSENTRFKTPPEGAQVEVTSRPYTPSPSFQNNQVYASGGYVGDGPNDPERLETIRRTLMDNSLRRVPTLRDVVHPPDISNRSSVYMIGEPEARRRGEGLADYVRRQSPGLHVITDVAFRELTAARARLNAVVQGDASQSPPNVQITVDSAASRAARGRHTSAAIVPGVWGLRRSYFVGGTFHGIVVPADRVGPEQLFMHTEPEFREMHILGQQVQTYAVAPGPHHVYLRRRYDNVAGSPLYVLEGLSPEDEPTLLMEVLSTCSSERTL